MKRIGITLILLSLLIVTGLFVISKPIPQEILRTPWRSASQLFSLLGTVLLCVTFILAARYRFLEWLFGGLDRIYRVHRTISVGAFLLLLHHPILLAIEVLPNVHAALVYVIPGRNIAYASGIIALGILLCIVVITMFVRLPYHIWKKIHEWAGVSLLFASFHVLTIGSDVGRSLPLRLFIFGFLLFGSFSYLYKRFFYYIFGPVHPYIIKEIHRVGDIVSLTLATTGNPLVFTPGQFAFLRFDSNGMEEEHPFSIVSAPGGSELRFSAKIVGDHTLGIKDISPGTSVRVIGPYGGFGQCFTYPSPLVCIAGGIGITPFVSMALHEENRGTNRRIYCFHSVRTADDAVHGQELSSVSQRYPWFTYMLHESANAGRLTGQFIQDHVDEFSHAMFFLCGPGPMMEAISVQLSDLGVSRSRILYEDFRLL